jgi:hypothetical protein
MEMGELHPLIRLDEINRGCSPLRTRGRLLSNKHKMRGLQSPNHAEEKIK